MTSDAKLGVELWAIDTIKPYAKNAKKHPKEQVAKLAAAIKKFGWTQPIVVDADGVIIAGHGRRLAAIELGLKKVPVVCRRDLSKDEADGLRLADNRVASTEYDTDLIRQEIGRLFEEGFEIATLGFDEKEIDFVTMDLGAIDDEVFVDNISEAVETQKRENKAKAAEVDETAAPIADALGFKRLTVAQSRIVRGFMARIEAQTGYRGADALVAYIQALA